MLRRQISIFYPVSNFIKDETTEKGGGGGGVRIQPAILFKIQLSNGSLYSFLISLFLAFYHFLTFLLDIDFFFFFLGGGGCIIESYR